MSLLMPEYERQLRAAARRLRRDRRSAGAGSRLFLVLACGAAVAVAAVAIIALGARRGTAPGPAPGTSAVQYDCAHGDVLSTRGPLVTVARGTVGGHPWAFETDQGRRGVNAVRAGVFVLGGRPYGLCANGVDLELIDATPHGIVYGFVPHLYTSSIVIEGTTDHGTARHPARAVRYPATTHRVAGGVLFVRALPASACAYSTLAIGLTNVQPIVVSSSTLTLLGHFTGRCRPGGLVAIPKPVGSVPASLAVAPPAGLSAAARRQFLAGRAVVDRAGCLACHTIGDQGNDGPGPPLTAIGRILHRNALMNTLVNPTAPMPSFKSLPPRQLAAVVEFLHELRGSP